MQASNELQGHGQGMRYQRLIPLGRGGMADVHLALALGQGGFKRLVVVKSVREELHGDPTMRQMFLAEARISARLNHPNVVQVSEVVETPEGVMLAMEYLDGLSLSAAYRSAGEHLTLAMRLRILCDVLAGLQYAHDLTDYHGRPLGIVHRDVSPQNIFLTFDGRVKLLDFGIAKVNAAPERTRAGVIKGRIAYMPLEQVTGKSVDRRTDVYAVGCLLWEALASQRMWGALSEPQIVRELIQGTIPRLSAQVNVDPELERIVNKATAQDPAQRYQSAEGFRLDLEHYLAALGSVNPREIGELLAAVCRDARVERQRELAEAVSTAERELSSLVEVESTRQTRASSLDQGSQVGPISSRPRTMRSVGPTSGSYRLSPSSSSSPPASEGSRSSATAVQPRPRQRGWLIALGLAAALAAGAWLPTLLRPPAATVAGPGPSSPKPVAPTVIEAAADAPVSASAEPTLEPAPAAAAASFKYTRGRARVAAPAPAPAPVASPAPRAKARGSCDPPYFFSAGIKTYKPECI